MAEADLSSNEPIGETHKQSSKSADSTIDDDKTDAAVEQIEHSESDEVLAAEDASRSASPTKPWYKQLLGNKKFSIPAAFIIVIALLAAVPITRYKLVGLVWKQSFTVHILDAQTRQPISEASLSLAGKTSITNNQGKATFRVKVGHDHLSFTKQYYKSVSDTVLVPIMKQKGEFTVRVVATGRQVPIAVVNKISGVAVANALVNAAGTQARTDKTGTVTIVLPANKTSVPAKIIAPGYNDAAVTITVSTAATPANTFQIVPAGKVYFLSNLSGKIDVIKTNLDGSGRQTVLVGTGNEDKQNTVLLASRDWKYLALLTQRTAGGNPELDLINTSNDQLTNIDQGPITVTLVGWSGHYFVYEVNRPAVPNWQPNAASIKSFNADTSKLLTIVNSDASGTSNADAQYQVLSNPLFLGSNLVYTTTWYQYPGYLTVGGRQNSVMLVGADGSNKKVVDSLDATSSYFGNIIQTELQEVLIEVSPIGTASRTFYQYDGSQLKPAPSTVTDSTFYQSTNPTYLISPSGNQTFWAEPRDGKNTLFVGDASGNNGKQIATLSDYSPYGWYTDDYVLVQKSGSELYIMPASGGTALKLSDYYKPAQTFNGYGGGYGGL